MITVHCLVNAVLCLLVFCVVGQASGANAEAVGMITHHIAELGWQFVEKSQTQKSRL